VKTAAHLAEVNRRIDALSEERTELWSSGEPRIGEPVDEIAHELKILYTLRHEYSRPVTQEEARKNAESDQHDVGLSPNGASGPRGPYKKRILPSERPLCRCGCSERVRRIDHEYVRDHRRNPPIAVAS
jgi:hypothetical protein